jgi:hypothetical protein
VAEPTKEDMYLPCWGVVPTAAELKPVASSDGGEEDGLEGLQWGLSWLLVGLSAITIYEIARRLLQ